MLGAVSLRISAHDLSQVVYSHYVRGNSPRKVETRENSFSVNEPVCNTSGIVAADDLLRIIDIAS